MKVAIVTNAIYNPLPKYVVWTDELKKNYCRMWGLDYICRWDNVHPELHPVWSKPLILLDALRDHDYVIWMDCDAAPVTFSIDIAQYVIDQGDCVIMGQDINNYNAGVFSVKKGGRSQQWLEYIEACHSNPKYHTGWMEQSAMIDSFHRDWWNIVKEPDKCIGWNNYMTELTRPDIPNPWHPGDWCLHMPCTHDDTRGAYFQGMHGMSPGDIQLIMKCQGMYPEAYARKLQDAPEIPDRLMEHA